MARKAEVILYLTSALSYIAAGIVYRGVLNWVVGPLWVVVWVEAASRIAALRERRRQARPLA